MTPSAPAPSLPEALHVCAGNQFGGVESMLLCIARESIRLPRPGLRHRFAVCFDGRFADELRAASAEVDRLPAVRLSRPWEVWRARRTLRRHLRTRPPAVVVTHAAWARLVFGRSLVDRGLPSIAWIHGASSPPSRMDRWGQRPRPRLVIANSRHTDAVTAGLFPGVERRVFYCPVPTGEPVAPETRDRLRREFGADSGDTIILMVARMEGWKGHELLLDGLARIPPALRWQCWIVGGPQTPEQQAYRASLDDRARARGVADRVRFLGERKDVRSLLAAADLFCQPNLAPEPFGIVFVEALDAGRPAVSTRLGGAMEIIDESCGRLTPPGDAAELGRTLETLIADPELRTRLGASGPARAAALCNARRQVELLASLLLASLPHH